jgi:hypothetical protein
LRPKAASDPAKKETKYTVVVNRETLGSAVLEVQELLQSLEARIDSQVMCKVTPPRSPSLCVCVCVCVCVWQSWDDVRSSLQSAPLSGKFVKPSADVC